MRKNIIVIALAALLLLASCATAKDPYEGLILNVDTEKTYTDFAGAIAEVSAGQTLQLHADAYLDGPRDFSFGFNLDLNGYTLSCAPFAVSQKGILCFLGTIDSHIPSVEIKNGTIKGSASNNNSSGLVRFVYVEDAVLSNVNIISEVNDSSITKSNSIYNAYSNVTINNTADNKVVGRIITYMNDVFLSSAGGVVSKTVVNGGTFSNDTTSGDTDIFTLSNEKGNIAVIINDCVVESGIIDNMSGEATKNVTNCVINGGTFNSIVKTWVGEGHTGSTVDGKYVVK